MEPYFSQNFVHQERKHILCDQQLFLQARDFIFLSGLDTNTMKDVEIKFTVYWSNGQFNNLYGDERITSARGSSSLNIPPYDYVTEAELLGVSFPKIDDEMYFIIDIPEFNSMLHSSDNKGSHDKFCIVYYDNSSMQRGDTKPIKGYDFSPKRSVFKPPLQSLNKMTVMFKKHNGDVIKLGDITPDGVTSQHVLDRISVLLNFKIKE